MKPIKGKAKIAGVTGSFDVMVKLTKEAAVAQLNEGAKWDAEWIIKKCFIYSTLHPIDLFDELTARGYRLNLVTGQWYQPIARYDFGAK